MSVRVCVHKYIYFSLDERKICSILTQMSSTTKMKHVVNEALQRYELPDEKHYIVKVKITPESFFFEQGIFKQ
jgi:hypothetical protein